MVKISIVTVVYNEAVNIKKSLESVKLQNKDFLEYIVIDGASSDGTTEYLESNREFIDVLISEDDEGLYYAMNKGKDLATGDFVLFMNAGDEFVDSSVIEELVKGIKEINRIYYGNTIVYYDKNYCLAPIRHHQSILFPIEFCKKYDYNVERYKVTAEGDYIYKALNRYEEVHLEVNMLLSKIEGFRIHCYSNLKGLRMMFKEVMELRREHSIRVPLHSKLMYPLNSLVKYCAFKLGGLPLIAKLVLISYPKFTERIDSIQ